MHPKEHSPNTIKKNQEAKKAEEAARRRYIIGRLIKHNAESNRGPRNFKLKQSTAKENLFLSAVMNSFQLAQLIPFLNAPAARQH